MSEEPLGRVSLTLGRKKTDGDFGNFEVMITDSRIYNTLQERDEALEEIKRNSKAQMGLIIKGDRNA